MHINAQRQRVWPRPENERIIGDLTKISFKKKGQYTPPLPHTRVDHYSKPQDPQASVL